MPFEQVETLTKSNMPPTALVSYMRPKARGKAAGDYDRDKAKPQLLISIPTSICFAKSKLFVLLVGNGVDAGKLRVKGSDDKKAIKAHDLKRTIIFKFGFVPALGDEIFDGERCDVRKVSDEEYEIDVACLKPTAKVPQQVVVASQQTVAARSGPPIRKHA